MKASEWRNTLPAMQLAAQPVIIEALLDPSMRMPIEWVGIPFSAGANKAILYVGCDSMMVGEPGDCVRVDLNCRSHQMVCDALGLQMPTAKMLDLIYASREVDVEPCTYPPTNGTISVVDPATGSHANVDMSSTVAMFAHDARVTAGVSGRAGLVCNSGKAWTLKASLGGGTQGDWTAANYAWYSKSAPYMSVSGGFKLWQPLSTMHNCSHQDYSQVGFAVHPVMLVNGTQMATASVITSPEHAALVSHEGPLPWSRHPRLDLYEPPGGVQAIAPPIEGIRLVGQPGAGGGAPGGSAGSIAAETVGKAVAVLAGSIAAYKIAQHFLGLSEQPWYAPQSMAANRR
jgi:hypothetical protein